MQKKGDNEKHYGEENVRTKKDYDNLGIILRDENEFEKCIDHRSLTRKN